MKLKKVFDLCSKASTCQLVDQRPGDPDTEQWIGDGYALYRINDLPYLEEQNIYSMFDVSPKKQEGFSFRHVTDGPPCSLEDTHPEEAMIEKQYMQIVSGGKLLTPMKTSRGIVLIDSKYLRPLEDQRGTTEYYAQGENLIAVKTGMYLEAVIAGVTVEKTLVEELAKLTAECRFTVERAESETR